MKKRLTNNLALKLAAIVFAFLLWLIVVNEIDPVERRTYSNVVVTMLHDELILNKGNTYRIVNGNTATVTVTAKRSILEKITPEAIRATADIKDIQLSSFVPIEVAIGGFEGEYRSATALPNNVEIKIESSKSTKFPINVETIGTLQDGYVLGNLVAQPETVQISGPKSLIGRIEKVVARVDINGISSDSTLEAELVLYDGGGNVIDQTSLETNIGGDKKVRVKVELLSTKIVEVKADVTGISPEIGYKIGDVTCEPQRISIAGLEEDIADINEITISSDMLLADNINEKTEETIDISSALPENIRLANENEKNVVVTIRVEKAGVKTFEVPINSITKNNVKAGYKIDFGNIQEIMLHFTGDDAALEALTLEQVEKRVSIDLKDCTEEKSYTVPVTVNLPTGVSMAEEAYVTLKMQKQEEEQKKAE
ncbi:MAG: hypothetical protein KHZ01_05125 [Lachnospiraceae bacterium]|nr:hypothetical protein [Lachnospiraceae bacterium]